MGFENYSEYLDMLKERLKRGRTGLMSYLKAVMNTVPLPVFQTLSEEMVTSLY